MQEEESATYIFTSVVKGANDSNVVEIFWAMCWVQLYGKFVIRSKQFLQLEAAHVWDCGGVQFWSEWTRFVCQLLIWKTVGLENELKQAKQRNKIKRNQGLHEYLTAVTCMERDYIRYQQPASMRVLWLCVIKKEMDCARIQWKFWVYKLFSTIRTKSSLQYLRFEHELTWEPG